MKPDGPHITNHRDKVINVGRFTVAAQDVCCNVLQLLSEEGHVGLSDINALQHCDGRLSLWEKNKTDTVGEAVNSRSAVV